MGSARLRGWLVERCLVRGASVTVLVVRAATVAAPCAFCAVTVTLRILPTSCLTTR